MTSADERRKYPRFSAEGLNVALTAMAEPLVTNLFNSAPAMVPVDFNRHGLAVLSNHSFQIGERLFLQVKEENGSILDVEGVIKSRKKKGDNFRFGVAFDFNQGKGERLMASSLEKLEHQARV
jgi:hypothetical protein